MAKEKRTKTLAEQLADLDEPAPKDFDPEEPDNYNSDSDESDAEAATGNEGREHYENVGKSKLRKRNVVPLGPQYEGSRVSRDAVEDDDSDDPFAKGFASGSDDDEESDAEARPDGEDDDDSEEGSGFSDEQDEMDGADSEEEDDGTSATDLSDEDEDMDDAEPSTAVDRDELRKIMAEEQKTVAATISEAAKADAEKGRAVRAQRKTFDSLLNTRIRLQKALIATNSMAAATKEESPSNDSIEDPIRAAETAASNLWNSLNDLRESLHTARTGEKRKRIEFNANASSDAIWNHMQTYEKETLPHRQVVLEKWSAKARGAPSIQPSNRLNNAASQQTIVDVLNAQLADPERLVKRTRMPRSCAPVQANAKVPESADVFDDADFYGLLLKELLEQRSQDVATGGNAALGGMAFNVPHWQAAREAKTKRQVDTRASKGRKLRYTVHEKLQNFMAPEDRGSWGERQIDELFGSLFGRRMGLGEADEEGADAEAGAEEDEEEDLGEQGLMLFRS
ncbi:TRAUB-domain-containing protein [Saccharata proteae CBS 121410]|uniref:Protein BFR2 n=1 Tax=Saccharata proteae CBS 121410 TaxID=1314787 RepID=A0A9P4I4L5_9PEZI|nr:TRAUB-domain-containing protein [Saccharata proteae CBS 121410]